MAPDARKRRAGLVCIACHAKKIKCDVQSKSGTSCSNCAAAQRDCVLRESRRNKTRKPLHEVPAQHSPFSDSPQDQDGVDDSSVRTNGNLEPGRLVGSRNDITNTLDSSGSTPVSSNLSRSRASGTNGQESRNIPPNLTKSRSVPEAAESYFGQTGFLQVYSPETQLDAGEQRATGNEHHQNLKLPSLDLQQSFIETYFDYCFPWCPVLERETVLAELAQSPLLTYALSVAGSHIQPPLIKHAGPATYYNQAKALFYEEQEVNPILCIKAITLLYWWSPRPPTTLHKDSSWWWTSAAIRCAQQLGLHRELTVEQQRKAGINSRLQRRIWWTLFSRERLTAVCQSRPAIIDPSDCSIREPSVEDFSDPGDRRAEIFVYWVRLCGIIGRVAKFLSRPTESSSFTPFPSHLANELIGWVESLPERLKLPIDQGITTGFNRDVHQLHLPYLAVVIILNLSRSSGPLPKAYTAAMMAATCIARIYRDLLARGTTRFLLPISCWYSGMAFLALLQARPIAGFKLYAESDIDTIRTVLKQLRAMWATANIFISGIERLLDNESSHEYPYTFAPNMNGFGDMQNNPNESEFSNVNGIDWTRYFPCATTQTSELAKAILEDYNQNQSLPLQNEDWSGSIAFQFQDFFEPFDPFSEMIPTL